MLLQRPHFLQLWPLLPPTHPSRGPEESLCKTPRARRALVLEGPRPAEGVEQRRPEMLAGGGDVQLTLEDVVDDGLGQVVHDVAVPVLQGQPEGESRVRRARASSLLSGRSPSAAHAP